ncbi:MAG: methylenetetrahydrofolate--tRNA-(uracil(54)-C(5))-methyltransferase (FADH(2)-oxidizing) TrmFO [Acholeplasma sp.]|nr:methylenetetrahydrofolate--tRNA-(uracil(54)-C(5))-methyltransferase (FADH(2)-oxidizing) TrmFO [Acholeplasma sp.]
MIKIIGAGLAGSEAAYYLANKGHKVKLYEMRPKKMTPAHQTNLFAELVCSNSLRSNDPLNAVGLLKREMQYLNSLIMEAALSEEVPAGSSLAVDRIGFSQYITDKIKGHPNIEVIEEEVTDIDTDSYTIICSGPLTSDQLSTKIQTLFDAKQLHFFDAVAPIIDAATIDYDIAYFKSRYDKGESDYINCPMTKEEYDLFYEALTTAERATLKDFEVNVFEGCMPVEIMASRGKETLLFGPLKPVGLEHEGHKPYAVVQLRQDDAAKSLFNIVGFQTNLKWSEQKRVIQLIPGLKNASIVRYGVMHQNTYLESPDILNACYQSIKYPKLFVAGQISGVEGYVESAASGLSAAYHLDRLLNHLDIQAFPPITMMGAMSRYISTKNKSFNPINANLGILPELPKHKKIDRKRLYKERALEAMDTFLNLKQA